MWEEGKTEVNFKAVWFRVVWSSVLAIPVMYPPKDGEWILADEQKPREQGDGVPEHNRGRGVCGESELASQPAQSICTSALVPYVPTRQEVGQGDLDLEYKEPNSSRDGRIADSAGFY